MAHSSQVTPTSSHISIQSILSPDDSAGLHERADTSSYPSSMARRAYDEATSSLRPPPVGLPSVLASDPRTGQRPAPLGIAPKISSLCSPMHPLPPREPITVYQQNQFVPQEHQLQQHNNYRQQQEQQQQQQQQQHPSHSPVSLLPLPQSPASNQGPQHHYYHTYIPQAYHQQLSPTQPSVTDPTSASTSGGNVPRDASEPVYTAAHSPEYGYPSPTTAGSDAPTIVEAKRGVAIIKRAPMRSSIACVRCRRSKIKCVNNGEGKAACETCLKSRRECHYPGSNNPNQKKDSELQFVVNTPAGVKSSNALKREEAGQPTERPAERKRAKKTDDSFRLDSQRSGAYFADEVLSAPYLTEAMWTEIFDIYRLHFATELPFLHMPTLKEKMGDKFKANQTRRSPNTNLVLLGVLTLTSRFHSDLVKYIAYSIANQNGTKIRPADTLKSDPWAASEYYADILTKALGPLRSSMTLASVERVQAFLMLGLYEWSQSKKKSGGLGAWMYVGVAIRMAQALGLCFEDTSDRHQHQGPAAATSVTVAQPDSGHASQIGTSSGPSSGTAPLDKDDLQESSNSATVRSLENSSTDIGSEAIATQEIRRRTMFSCFVLDRMLACGKERLRAIRSEDLQIQLPCSDFSFDLSEKVQTGFLKPLRPESRGDTDLGGDTKNNNDSVLARFIRLVDIWGEISKYSFSGGRLAEKRAPWEDSEFRRLRGVLDNFYASLPSTFKLSTSNYHRHENHQASSAYVSLHMLGAVCQIMLHREYIPFIPVRCPRPMGPLDEPTFPEGSAPEGFWEDSASQVFKAARDIVHLIEICQGRKKMPMSALVVFAIWTAAFVGIYAWHFPQLDTNHYMSDAPKTDAGPSQDEDNHIARHGPTGVTFSVLKNMSKWLQMATTYVKYFRDMDKYYEGVKKDYWAHADRHEGKPTASSVRLGGDGGGLDEWKVHSTKVTNNGIISSEEALAEEMDLSRASSTINNSTNRGSSTERGSVATPSLSFMPIDSRATRGQWLAPAGGVPIPRDAALSRQRQREGSAPVINGSGSGDFEMGIRTDTVASGSSIDGLPYTNENSGHFADNSTGGGGSSSTASEMTRRGLSVMLGHEEQQHSANPPPSQRPPWGLYAQPPDQQQLYMQSSMHPAQEPSSTSSPPYGYIQDELQSGFVDMKVFYSDLAGVEQYVDKNQGRRWQEASQAIGIEQFSQGDSEWQALWATQPYGVYQSPPLGQVYTGMLNNGGY